MKNVVFKHIEVDVTKNSQIRTIEKLSANWGTRIHHYFWMVCTYTQGTICAVWNKFQKIYIQISL